MASLEEAIYSYFIPISSALTFCSKKLDMSIKGRREIHSILKESSYFAAVLGVMRNMNFVFE
jgi:hypothetical protein